METCAHKKIDSSDEKSNTHCLIDENVDEFIGVLEDGAIAEFVREYGQRKVANDGRGSPLFLLSTEHQLMATVDAALSESGLEYTAMQYAYHKIQTAVSKKRQEWEQQRTEHIQDFETECVPVFDSMGRSFVVIKHACDTQDGERKPAAVNTSSTTSKRKAHLWNAKQNTKRLAGQVSRDVFNTSAPESEGVVVRGYKRVTTSCPNKQTTLDSWLKNGSIEQGKVDPVKKNARK